MSGFVHVERVRFGDLDAMRHLNNVVFLRYFETARISYLRHVLPTHQPDNPEEEGFGLIFAECHISYRSPVRYDEQVAIECQVSDVRRSSFRVPFHMHVDERLVAEGYGVLVGYDYTAGRSAALPDAIRARLDEETAVI
jgi:acyl-CoA thioester hydrolase